MHGVDGICSKNLTLNKIAQKYNVRIANVATRYILDKAAVAGVIIGVKSGNKHESQKQ